MKLSMWMIANRLSSLLDIKTEIQGTAPAILNSARLVYATNCVYVYEENGRVIYDGEGDKIYIENISVKEAFEILQGVFDYYQDWESQIQEDLKKREFQSLIDHSWFVFQNPLILMNANFRKLAMSTRKDVGDMMDDEWNYLETYGYSSLSSIRKMKENTYINFDTSVFQKYSFSDIKNMTFPGAAYNLQFHQISCGKLILLQKGRTINPGDYQLMQKLADYLEPVLSISDKDTPSGNNAFHSLIFGKPYSDYELEMQKNYRNWQEDDIYQVAIVELQPQDYLPIAVSTLLRTIQHMYTHAFLTLDEHRIIMLINHELTRDNRFLSALPVLCSGNDIRISFSLTDIGYRKAAQLYQQALHALTYGKHYAPKDTLYHFYTYSIPYILETPYLADKLQACHPVIRKLWKMKRTQNDVLFDTLREYLDAERSLSKTAAVLFTHRNTVLYRIKKCQELLNDDLDNPKLRYYVRLSIYCLEMAADSASQIPAASIPSFYR